MKKHIFALIGAVCAALLLSGCFALRPRPDQTQFFVLTPRTWSAETPPYPCNLNVAVVRVEFSEYLDNSQIATRPTREQITYNPFVRWAEPLSSGLSRTLVTNLSFIMGSQMVQVYPNRVPGYKPDILVFVHIVRFDGVLGGPCRLVLRWRVTSADGKDMFFAADRVYKADSGPTYNDYVGALSQMWTDFADNVAQEVVKLQAEGKLPQK